MDDSQRRQKPFKTGGPWAKTVGVTMVKSKDFIGQNEDFAKVHKNWRLAMRSLR